MAIAGKITYRMGSEVRDVLYPKADREKFTLHSEGGGHQELHNETDGWVAMYDGLPGKEEMVFDPIKPGYRFGWGGASPTFVMFHVQDPDNPED
ncbi:hypothetical protein [Streptomyces sp. ISL-11]|uniref:hypothetical protein n=1 Tax=Streptomyces sp. ISL-11 TaxID=2819174 RepID=UPI001BE8BBCF|nr:hypothetical protein [Streptomyces sp. ISL-11]MBT2387504.1 hypothetical protein [Streptomyces sp. ISL-11]